MIFQLEKFQSKHKRISEKKTITENPEADFIFSLPSFVPGKAGVISFIQLLHIHYCHLRTVFIEAVLIPALQKSRTPERAIE